VLRLTLLAPDIVEAILSGRAGELGLPRLLEPFPLAWADQKTSFQLEHDPARYPAEYRQFPAGIGRNGSAASGKSDGS